MHPLRIGVDLDLENAVFDVLDLAEAQEAVLGILEIQHDEEAQQLKDLLKEVVRLHEVSVRRRVVL